MFRRLRVQLRTLRRLLAYLRPMAGWMTLSVALGVATIGGAMGLLGTSAYLIASAALHPSIAALQVAIVGVRFFGIMRGVFRYLERLVSHSVNFRLLSRLRVWFYQAVEPLAPARLQQYHSGDLLGRALGDIEILENFYVRAVAPPVTALVVTLGVSLWLGRSAPVLGWLLLGCLSISGVGLPLLAQRLGRQPGLAQVRAQAGLSQSLVDVVQGMPDLLAFGAQEAFLERVRQDSRAFNLAQQQTARLVGGLNAANSLVMNGSIVALLILAVPLVRGQQITGVDLAVFCLVFLASFEAVNPLAQAAQQLNQSLAAGQRLFELADVQPAVEDVTAPFDLPVLNDVSIQHLSFSYPAGDRAACLPALVNFSLDLPPGKKVALVGSSGAGKTTLFNLLLRFWDTPPGTIFWGGSDIRLSPAAQVRRRIALVGQRVDLFSGTLRHNLSLAACGAAGSTGAADEATLWAALEAAQLADFVRALPQGLDTWVGPQGLQLSGGERQRVSLARALLQDAPLWLLDEPAAGLDAGTERELLLALRSLWQQRSVIWITHHLAGLEEMDEILVMLNGQVVERGSLQQLLALEGRFARMWRLERRVLADEPA